ncbi:MAG: activase [Deltaproteobacteria bacterium]|nr:activase [Deltaproteobacteria bacterium]MBN2673493.1 activase [Deltaproteobacteria bacterium]
MERDLIGIDIGSTSVKIVRIATDNSVDAQVMAHDGNVPHTVRQLLERISFSSKIAPLALATGTEGRFRLKLPNIIAPMAIENALSHLSLDAKALVCMGGEDLVVYTLDAACRITATYSGNKCASGTGEFFRQQLGRMNMNLEDIESAATGATLQKLSSRCSVFMKSDCTHKLNKGEATPGDIALSLSKIMADKVSDFLTKTRIQSGKVVLTGGVTQNPFVAKYVSEAWPTLDIVVPTESPYFEAFGTAFLAAEFGAELPSPEELFNSGDALSYDTYPSITAFADKVKYMPSMRGKYDPDAEYILGVDGGSTTTKVALVNAKTYEIVAAHYGRTHGNPVKTTKECIEEVKKQIGPNEDPNISLVSTTGSSRELLGVFLGTSAVYNEIIAHTTGTTFFEKAVDTIFEIGGQDAKYVSINNKVPIDYAMNEACSAGTGSFLEESCKGDLSIDRPEEIGPIAMNAEAPLKFGEHCSAFINSDIRKAIQQGAARENIVAGLIFSIVSNYLNRVSGNRRVGNHVMLQGGVAKNPAVPLAFAQLTGQEIIVPPDPELMGCFGVALLAHQKANEGFLEKAAFSLNALLQNEIVQKGTFVCKSCDNYCTIRRLEVNGTKYPFGGRCSKFTNLRKKKPDNDDSVNYVEVRTRMLFEEFAPAPNAHPDAPITVGVPMAFSVHSLWPLYSWFFHELGVKLVISEQILSEGIAKIESNYCFPSEIAHGALEDVLRKNPDFVFMPFFKKMPTLEAGKVHATVCPLTQGMPFFLKQAFGLSEDVILRPVVNLKADLRGSSDEFEQIAVKMGFTAERGAAAYKKGVEMYDQFLRAYRALGDEVLEQVARHPEKKYICLLGRPYNAFTRDANMGIPRKLLSNGVSVIPFDMIYDVDAEIFPNMYWYYGQQDMKAVRVASRVPNLYPVWISNFSCAPDSFMLHYLRWMMGQKPYLVLEIDSHSADAGIDTRIEAFLDIIDSFRRGGFDANVKPYRRRFVVEQKKEFVDIVDTRTGERIDMRDPRVTFIWSSMGEFSSGAIAAASRKAGVNSIHLPIPNVHTTQLAKNVASGKECIPSLIVLGGILHFFQKHPPNQEGEILLFYMPSTLGPCRTGQYYVFYERLFEELGFENAVILVCDSSNSYRELGSSFTKDAWWGVILGDYFTDMHTGLRLLAKDVDAALKTLQSVWEDVIEVFSNNGNIEKALDRAGKILTAIPRRQRLEDLQKVLIVGEIYVRRDSFSVKEINDFLISKNIFPKIAGISEWIDYTDHCRWRGLQKQKGELKFKGLIQTGKWKEHAMYHVEGFYKEMIVHKVARYLKPTGLIPDVPTDMHEIIGNTEKLFIDPRLESEATVSAGAAATGMLDGYNGTVIISPFSCLPGRLVEGVYGPWARKHNFPYIALENDGQPYSPSVVARMEIFAHNVMRFKK